MKSGEDRSGRPPAPTAQAVALLVTCMFVWGANAVVGKLAVGHISPLLLTAARWVFAALILLALSRRQLAGDWPAIKPRLPYLFAMGGLGFGAFNGLFYTALLYTSAINVTILQAAMPMFIFLLNFAVFHTRASWAQIIGYGLTLVGVTLTAARGDFAQLASLDINRGDLIMLGAAFTYASYSVALRSKPAMHWLSFLTVLTCSAAVVSTGLALYEWTTPRFIWPTTLTAWIIIAFTVVFASILSQGFYIRGVELIGANPAALFLNLVPIFGALLAVLLLREAFHLYHAVAMALVIGGIVLAQRLARRS